MEDDDTFDAGRGSFLTRDGRVQLRRAADERARTSAPGVSPAWNVCANPIQAARLVLEKSPHVYFVGSGAERFATQHGMHLIDNTDLIVPRERETPVCSSSSAKLPAAQTPPSAATSTSSPTPMALALGDALRERLCRGRRSYTRHRRAQSRWTGSATSPRAPPPAARCPKHPAA